MTNLDPPASVLAEASGAMVSGMEDVPLLPLPGPASGRALGLMVAIAPRLGVLERAIDEVAVKRDLASGDPSGKLFEEGVLPANDLSYPSEVRLRELSPSARGSRRGIEMDILDHVAHLRAPAFERDSPGPEPVGEVERAGLLGVKRLVYRAPDLRARDKAPIRADILTSFRRPAEGRRFSQSPFPPAEAEGPRTSVRR